MASYVPAKYGVEFITYVMLESVATANEFQSNPTLSAGDVKIVKDGGASANLTTLPTVTPASGKWVKVTVSATEMQADNVSIIFSDAAGSEWKTLGFTIPTAARQIDDLSYPTVSGRSTDVTTTGEVGIDWANIGSPTTTVALSGTTAGLIDGAITAAKIASDAITAAKIADGAIDAATFAAGAINAAAIATDAITAAKIADDAIDSGAVAASAVTKIQTGLATPTNITAGTIATVTNLTNAPTNGDLTATMKTSVQTAATAATPSVTVSDKTGFSLSALGIQAIWDALTSALTTVGSIGKLLVDNINATISSRSSHTAANVRTEMDSNSTKLDAAISTRMATFTYTAPDNTTVGTINTKLGTPLVSVSADIAGVKTDSAAILADTGTDGVVVASGSKTGYSLANDQSSVTVGTVNDLGTTARGRVNTEVLDVLDVDTFAEPASVPAATSTLVAKWQWLFALARNKMTQTSTTQTLRNDADSASIATSTVSDDGTVMIRGEWS